MHLPVDILRKLIEKKLTKFSLKKGYLIVFFIKMEGDPIQAQTNIILPFLKEVSTHSLFKKDKQLKEKLEKAQNSLEFQDTSPTIDFIIALLNVEKKNLRLMCFKVLNQLFLSNELEFFLAQNTSTDFIKKIVQILNEHKSPQFLESCDCLLSFLKSPN